jgi:hypothetical protein
MVAPALLFLLLGASLAVIVAWLDAGAGAPSLITGRWLHGTKWGLPASIHAGCCLTCTLGSMSLLSLMTNVSTRCTGAGVGAGVSPATAGAAGAVSKHVGLSATATG